MKESAPGRRPTKLGPRFEDALSYAARLHANQLRDDTEIPYVSHLLGVASLVLEHGGTEDEAIAALLHDAAEDQGGDATLAEIRGRFGQDVESIVRECSDSFETPKPPWRARKEKFIAGIADAGPSALLVELADKLHNARCILADYRQIGDALWTRFNGGKDGTLWYYRELVSSFRSVTSGFLVDELARTVDSLDAALDYRSRGRPSR